VRQLDALAQRAYHRVVGVDGGQRPFEVVDHGQQRGNEFFQRVLVGSFDNLERALAAIDPDTAVVRPLGEGVELTHKSLLDVLRQHGVQIVDPAAQGFDPALHQAVAMVPHPEFAANQVVEVLQKGYTLSERLVRPAMVVVSQGVPGTGGQG
jgi:molecular chaperone GrpE